jgi:predicted benzoate:H+ symporter BenE
MHRITAVLEQASQTFQAEPSTSKAVLTLICKQVLYSVHGLGQEEYGLLAGLIMNTLAASNMHLSIVVRGPPSPVFRI